MEEQNLTEQPKEIWGDVRLRSDIKARIKRVAEGIRKQQKPRLSMDSCMLRAEEVVRSSFYFHRIVPPDLTPDHSGRQKYWGDHAIQDEMRDKDKILKEIQNGTTDQIFAPKGIVTVQSSKIIV